MGLFDAFRRPKRLRGPGKPAAELKARAEAREKQEQLRFLRELKSRDPRLYEQIMLRRMGLGDDRDELATTLKTLSQLREAGLVDDPKDAAGRQWVRDLAPMLPGLLQVLGGIGAQTQGHQMAPAQPYQPQAAPPPAQPSTEPELDPAELPVEMSTVSRQVIAVLEPLSPTQAAEWLLGQRVPFATWLADQLVATPDDQIPALLGEIVAQVPDLAGLMAWLRARPSWLMEFVREVRRLKAPARASSAGV